MFENIGDKIKSLATVLAVLGIVVYGIWGLVLITSVSFFTGLLVIVLGSLVSWVGSFFMYGFGELIDKVCEIERNTRNSATKTTAPTTETPANTYSNASNQGAGYSLSAMAAGRNTSGAPWICRKCNTKNDAKQMHCKECGEYKNK